MKNTNWKKEIVIWILLLAPFIYALFIWNKVPERVPTHFNSKGEADDYAGKALALLVLPATNILVYFILLVIPRIDPRRKNYEQFIVSYQNIRLVVHLFFIATFIYISSIILYNKPLYINAFLAGTMLFLALLGNYMRTVRSNWFVGIRTPWTLSNDVVWRKTNELGGRIMFYSGLVLAVVVLFLPEIAAAMVMSAGIFIMIMIPVVYSYFEYKKVMRQPQ
jgi:uncharacterized membrane protein